MKLFKIKFILFISVIVFLSTLLIGTGVYYIVRTELVYNLSDKIQEAQLISSLSSEINKFLIIFVPFLLVASTIVSILILNRMDKSFNFIKKNINTIIHGDFMRSIDIPKAKEFSELTNLVEELKSELNNKILEQKKIINQSISIMDKILKELDCITIDREKVSKLSSEFLNKLEKLQILISRYKTG